MNDWEDDMIIQLAYLSFHMVRPSVNITLVG